MKEIAKRVKRAKRGAKSTAKSTVAKIPQPHGGALNAGGTPGNVGGSNGGRPPSAIRAHLRGSFDQRVSVIEQIADAEVMTKIEVPFASVLPHIRCPKCGDPVVPKDVTTLPMLTITGKTSASPKDRIAAMKLMGDLGLGAVQPITAEQVKEKIGGQIEVLRREMPPALFKRVLPLLEKVWKE